jgi:hypothetical protein
MSGTARRTGQGIEFVPTADERVMVERLSGLLVTEEEIARDWIKPPISRLTLRKHFRAELARGRQRTLVRLKATMLRSAEAGSVRALIYLLERFFHSMLPPMPPRVVPNPDAASMPEGRVRIYKADATGKAPAV